MEKYNYVYWRKRYMYVYTCRRYMEERDQQQTVTILHLLFFLISP